MLATHAYALKQGARLSQYEISGVLGSGGFGITYLAQDTALDAPVAIKEYLPSDLALRQEDSRVTAVSTTAQMDFKWGLDRFLDEARTLAKFRHPHVVHIFQVFEANNTAYIVMEYAKGPSLSELVQRGGQLREVQTREILLPVLDGLKRVHERGFLHRDIKPGNIIMRDEGGPALIDFGAARQAIETRSRSITSIVTEGYAPLEQYDPNGNQGPWTDIYALGAVAYKCLTGTAPPAATARIRNDPLTPLNVATQGRVSPEFASAVHWALAVYEEDRPQNIESFAAAISTGHQQSYRAPAEATRVLGGDKTQLISTSRPMRAPPPEDRPHFAADFMQRFGLSQNLALPIALVLLAILIAGGGLYWRTQRMTPEDQRAWEIAARENTIAAYETYRRQEPEGYYANRALDLVSARRTEADSAWADAQRQGTAAALQAYLQKYAADGLHGPEAAAALGVAQEKERVAHLQALEKDRAARAQAAAEERRIRSQNVGLQQQLREAGSYNGPITGDAGETAAALNDFQRRKGLAITGIADDATRSAMSRDIARGRETRAAFTEASETKSRAGYEAFLTRFGGSAYAPDVRRRISQCHMQTASQSTPQTETIQRTGAQAVGDRNSACAQSRANALSQLQSYCSAQGGRIQNARPVAENATPNIAGAILGGLIDGAIGRRYQPRAPSMQCSSNVQADCAKTVTTSSQAEVCP